MVGRQIYFAALLFSMKPQKRQVEDRLRLQIVHKLTAVKNLYGETIKL